MERRGFLLWLLAGVPILLQFGFSVLPTHLYLVPGVKFPQLTYLTWALISGWTPISYIEVTIPGKWLGKEQNDYHHGRIYAGTARLTSKNVRYKITNERVVENI